MLQSLAVLPCRDRSSSSSCCCRGRRSFRRRSLIALDSAALLLAVRLRDLSVALVVLRSLLLTNAAPWSLRCSELFSVTGALYDLQPCNYSLPSCWIFRRCPCSTGARHSAARIAYLLVTIKGQASPTSNQQKSSLHQFREQRIKIIPTSTSITSTLIFLCFPPLSFTKETIIYFLPRFFYIHN